MVGEDFVRVRDDYAAGGVKSLACFDFRLAKGRALGVDKYFKILPKRFDALSGGGGLFATVVFISGSRLFDFRWVIPFFVSGWFLNYRSRSLRFELLCASNEIGNPML